MRIAIFSDTITLNTGYAQNTLNLIKGLNDLGHDAVSIGLGHAGDVVRYQGIDIYPAVSPFMLQKSIQKFQPDVMMHIRDNWIFTPKYVAQPYTLLPLCKKEKVKLINYTPVQAAPLPPEFVETISTQADFTYITNQYGVDALIKQGAPKDKLGCLYNGVDSSVFRTFDVPRKQVGLPVDKKLAIFVGANMDYRKEIPLAMLAFKKYNDKYNNGALYLHTNPFGGFDIPLFIQNLGLQKSCFLKSAEGMKLMTWDLSTAEMAGMYNIGDAFLTLTAAEGFNEPLLEALATGLPAVVTDTPIHREIFSCFGNRIQFVEAREILPTTWAYEHIADPDDAAEKLAKAFDMGKKPINMQQFKQFSWLRIAEQLAKKAEEICQQPFEEPGTFTPVPIDTAKETQV